MIGLGLCSVLQLIIGDVIESVHCKMISCDPIHISDWEPMHYTIWRIWRDLRQKKELDLVIPDLSFKNEREEYGGVCSRNMEEWWWLFKTDKYLFQYLSELYQPPLCFQAPRTPHCNLYQDCCCCSGCSWIILWLRPLTFSLLLYVHSQHIDYSAHLKHSGKCQKTCNYSPIGETASQVVVTSTRSD